LILVTSLETAETAKDEIQMLASHKSGHQWLVTTPKLEMDLPPNGGGDMTAAVFLGRILAGETADKALESTAASVYAVFEKTQWLNRRELALIQAQDCFKIGTSPFKAVAL
jgi:pyridoxine kinase